MKNFFIKWLAARTSTERIALGSLSTATTFYFAAYLSTSISQAVKHAGDYGLAIHATIFTVLLFLIVLVTRLISYQLERNREEIEAKKITLSRAYALCDKCLTERCRVIETTPNSSESTLALIGFNLSNISNIVDAAYSTFESSFGKSSDPDQRIDFEVTFMTRSKFDDMITIPAASNKDGRQPRSMILREQKPGIYENSVTGSVYKQDCPRMEIVEDTEAQGTLYQQLYANQTDRIKSSIVYPVLSSNNRLLGTLVVHCDKSKFFSLSNRKFWSDLLEIFSKRIALEVLSLEGLENVLNSETKLNVQLPHAPLY